MVSRPKAGKATHLAQKAGDDELEPLSGKEIANQLSGSRYVTRSEEETAYPTPGH